MHIISLFLVVLVDCRLTIVMEEASDSKALLNSNSGGGAIAWLEKRYAQLPMHEEPVTLLECHQLEVDTTSELIDL